MSTNPAPEKTDFLYPETAVEALRKWDAGNSVFTIEMGGLGPGYEQCIHITTFEIIRAFKDDPTLLTDKNPTARMDKMLSKSPLIKKLGLSGAQAGAAQHLAFRALKYGWRTVLKEVPLDRRIQVSKHFPSLED